MITYFLQQMLLYSLLLSPIYIVGRFLYIWTKKCTIIWTREALLLGFTVFCISIFSQTILPKFSVINGRLGIYREVAGSNFELFRTIRQYALELNGPIAEIAFYNLAGNILLFVPFGIFFPLLWRKFRSIWIMSGIALIIPLFIEGTQYFIGRSVDVDDVLLNAVGILCGCLGYLIIVFFKVQVKKVVTDTSSLLK